MVIILHLFSKCKSKNCWAKIFYFGKMFLFCAAQHIAFLLSVFSSPAFSIDGKAYLY